MAEQQEEKKKNKDRKVINSDKRHKAILYKIEHPNATPTECMREVGYAPGSISNPKILTESKPWKKVFGEKITDEFLAEKVLGLFDQKKLDYFTYPLSATNEEIAEHFEALGLKLVAMKPGQGFWYAYYMIPDGQIIAKAADIALKVKGGYAPVKKDIRKLTAHIHKTVEDILNYDQ